MISKRTMGQLALAATVAAVLVACGKKEEPVAAPSSGMDVAPGMPSDVEDMGYWHLAEEASMEAQAAMEDDPFGFGWDLDNA